MRSGGEIEIMRDTSRRRNRKVQVGYGGSRSIQTGVKESRKDQSTCSVACRKSIHLEVWEQKFHIHLILVSISVSVGQINPNSLHLVLMPVQSCSHSPAEALQYPNSQCVHHRFPLKCIRRTWSFMLSTRENTLPQP